MLKKLFDLFGNTGRVSDTKATNTGTENHPSPTIPPKKMNSSRCPICEVQLDFELDHPSPEDEKYEFDYELIHAGNGDCPFCKAKIAIVFDRFGEMSARDKQWDAVCKTFYDKETEISDKISDLEIDLDDDPTDKKRATIEARIERLNEQLERAEAAFNEKEEKYIDKQMRWQARADDKFGLRGL